MLGSYLKVKVLGLQVLAWSMGLDLLGLVLLGPIK